MRKLAPLAFAILVFCAAYRPEQAHAQLLICIPNTNTILRVTLAAVPVMGGELPVEPVSLWEPGDASALMQACSVAEMRVADDSFVNRALLHGEFQIGCVHTAKELTLAIFNRLQALNFDGWRIRTIRAKTGVHIHTTVLLTSPDGKNYLFDNYLGHQELARMVAFTGDDGKEMWRPAIGRPESLWVNAATLIWEQPPGGGPGENDLDRDDCTVGRGCTGGIGQLPTGGPFCPLPQDSGAHSVQGLTQGDPNDKAGSQGSGAPRYLAGTTPLRYVISFENEATATAPAQEVVITDRLDPAKVDLSGLSLGPISFGDRVVTPPPGATDFKADVDLNPDKNLIVRIDARLDPTTATLTWRMTSIDPATDLLTDDPLGGFLPPSVTPPQGQGSVLFTVMPKTGITTGTQVQNQATIVFDNNAPVPTPVWTNTLDNDPPKSHVILSAGAPSSTFKLQWSGKDVGSGIQDYTILMAKDGGPFSEFLTNTIATSASFTGQSGSRYGFLSVARDQAGNVEDKPRVAEAVARIPLFTVTAPTNLVASINASGHVALSWSDTGSRTGFQIERSTGINFARIASVPANVSSFEDTKVFSGQTYTYRVRAIDGKNASDFSNEATVAVAFPKLVIRQRQLSFTSPRPGAVRTASLTIRNDGQATLTGAVGAPGTPFSVVAGGGAFSLAPRASQSVTVQFAPSQTGVANGSVVVTSNDARSPSVTVALTGTAR